MTKSNPQNSFEKANSEVSEPSPSGDPLASASYSDLSKRLQETLRSLEDPELELDSLARQLERGYDLLEKLKSKLTEAECQVEKVIRLHQGEPPC